MVEDRIQRDDVRAADRWAADRWAAQLGPGEGVRRPGDVYEEWLAATKIAYTQGG